MGKPVTEPSAVADDVARMVALWERVLQRAPIDPAADFFDLGGDSLHAVALFAELAHQTGREWPITTIYDAPTPASLAAALAVPEPTQAAPAASPLVLLKPGPAEAPALFIGHGLDGTVFELRRLAGHLTVPGAVYGLQARGLDGAEPFTTVEAMADYYVAAIRQCQSHGPYLLVGYSFGGLVALAMARRLTARGAPPALVACLDTFWHPRYWPAVARLGLRARQIRRRLAGLVRSPIAGTRAYWHERATRRAVSPLSGAGLAPWLAGGLLLPAALRRVHACALTALLAHRPAYYPGRVMFFQPRINYLYPKNPLRLWRALVGDFVVHPVAGDHLSMIADDVGDLAAKLSETVRQALGAAQPRAGPCDARRIMIAQTGPFHD